MPTALLDRNAVFGDVPRLQKVQQVTGNLQATLSTNLWPSFTHRPGPENRSLCVPALGCFPIDGAGGPCCFPYVPHPRSENLTLVEPLLIFTESWGLLEILRKAFKMISKKKKVLGNR